MPDPREAIYDVLLAKKRRADEWAAAQAAANDSNANWEQYEQDNQRANTAYSRSR